MELDKIITGDSAVVLQSFPPDCIDLTVTSPPYDNLRTYNGFTFDFEAIARELYRVTKQGGVVAWVVGDATVNGSETGTSFRQALYFMQCGFKLHDTMIYATDKQPLTHKRYEQRFEYMFIFCKGKLQKFNGIREASLHSGKSWASRKFRANKNGDYKKSNIPTSETKLLGNIWYYATNSQTNGCMTGKHPATFPEALANDHIISWSNEGDIVLDPFCGAGTTPKMAKFLNRHYIGIEISQAYVDIINKRLYGITD